MKIILTLVLSMTFCLPAQEVYREKALEILVRTADTAISLQMPSGRFIKSKEEATKVPEDYTYAHTAIKESYIKGLYLILPFAVLYTTENPQNPYYKNPKILASVNKAMALLDTTYQMFFHEHRFCSYLAPAYDLLKNDLTEEQKGLFLKVLRWGGEEMARRVKKGAAHTGKYTAREIGVNTNHWSIYNLALLRMGNTLGNREWVKLATQQLKNLVAAQNPDGYWDEWNGPAVSYNFVTTHTINSYYTLTRDPKALAALKKSLEFHMRYSYPDFNKIETIDGRNQLTFSPPMTAQAAFSHTPEGRRFARNLLEHWAGAVKNRLAWDEEGCLLAENMTQWESGPEAPLPTEQPSYTYRLKLPGGVRRSAPWLTSYSAISFPEWPENRFFLNRQIHFSVWHDSAGLVLAGPNTRGHQYGGTFLMIRNRDQSVGILKSGDIKQTAQGDIITGQYDKYASVLTLKEVDKNEFLITGEVREQEDAYALTPPIFEEHLLLNVREGDTLETEGSGKIVLTAEYRDLPPYKVGKWIKKGRWTLEIPSNSRLVWPYGLFNSYTHFGYPAALKLAMVVLTFPTPKDRLECRLKIKG